MREWNETGLSGVLFGALLIAGFVVDPNTMFMPEEAEAVAYLQDGPLRIMVGSYLGLLAAGALIWFSACLSTSLRRLGDLERFSLVAFGGGMLGAAMLVVGEVSVIAAAERTWVVGTIDPGAAATLFDLSGIAFGNGAPIGFGLLVAATGVATLRLAGHHRRGAVLSLVIAAGLFSPYGWAVLGVVVIWVPVAGIAVVRAESSPMNHVGVS